ncbi:MAG: AAA family ATPase [Syntrophaceae bacterium]|nr:AAA family ATPase [Syntrophaceae bacterium]
MFIKSIQLDPKDFPLRDRYPFNVPSLAEKISINLEKNIVFFTGKNGVGKSTLLDCLAMKSGLLPWGGMKAHASHSNPQESQLSKYISLTWEKRKPYGFYFRAEVFFNIASSLDDILMDDPGRASYFGGGSLNTLSHGESFLNFFRGYSFGLDGLYLIDEPEAALDPLNQIEFVKVLLENSSKGAKQYVISTLSPIVLACPGSQIFNFDEAGVHQITWRDTDSYKFYTEFLKDPGKFFN